MVPLNYVVVGVLFLVFFFAFPLIIQFSIRQVCAGKLLCAILGKEKPLDFKLLKTKTREGEGEFVQDGKDKWVIDTTQVKLVKYPIMWPKTLRMFQQIVGCSLYVRGRADPLNWENPATGGLSSKELPAILDPHWLTALVQGVEEGASGGRADRNLRMFTLLAMAGSLLCLVLIFVVMFKLGGIEDALGQVQQGMKLIYP